MTPHHLVHFLPSLQVGSPNLASVMQEHLGDDHVHAEGHCQVQRGEALGVLVIGAGPQVKQGSDRLSVVLGHRPVHSRGPVLGAEVDDGPPVDQSYQHPSRLDLQPGCQAQWTICKKTAKYLRLDYQK